jgi:hypothetical protein
MRELHTTPWRVFGCTLLVLVLPWLLNGQLIWADFVVCNSQEKMPVGTHDCQGNSEECGNILDHELCPDEASCTGVTRTWRDNTHSWECQTGLPDHYCGNSEEQAVCWIRKACKWNYDVGRCVGQKDCERDFYYPKYDTTVCVPGS